MGRTKFKGGRGKGIPIHGPGAEKFKDEWFWLHWINYECFQQICAPCLLEGFKSFWMGGWWKYSSYSPHGRGTTENYGSKIFLSLVLPLKLVSTVLQIRNYFWGFHIVQFSSKCANHDGNLLPGVKQFSSFAHNSDVFIEGWCRILSSWYSEKKLVRNNIHGYKVIASGRIGKSRFWPSLLSISRDFKKERH